MSSSSSIPRISREWHSGWPEVHATHALFVGPGLWHVPGRQSAEAAEARMQGLVEFCVLTTRLPALLYTSLCSFVCPTEIIAFSDRAKEFEALNCQVSS